MVQELSYKDVRGTLAGMEFTCDSSADLMPLTEIIGQDRALRALQFGLKIESKGFNVFISGMPGTGRRTAIISYLEEVARGRPIPDDWCYVYNFRDPNKPNALRLNAGSGSVFKKDMELFVTEMQRALSVAFESEEYSRRRGETLKAIEAERDEVTKQVNALAGNSGFLLQRSPIGLMLIPIQNGRPINEQEFAELPPQLQAQIQERRETLQGELLGPLKQFRNIEGKMANAIKDLNRSVATFAQEPISSVLKDKFSLSTEVVEYIEHVEEDILDNLQTILQGDAPQQPQLPFQMPGARKDPRERYIVNLIVDNSELKGAPVIMELNPTYSRLFGAIEKEAQFGALVTNYTMIKAGSAHSANGGYLLVPVEGLFANPLIYETLKRAISNEELEIEESPARFGFMLTGTLSPEPIPFNTKVIIVGDPQVYQILFAMDREFKEL
ncbi:AAA family ATPase, partial [Candidatus Bathyarchaeota archaeon]|nr:AAA family ATPase [Candidatus Bathyarchaeota archaeon]